MQFTITAVPRFAAVVLLAVGLVLGSLGDAQAFKRKSSVTGPGNKTVTNEATTTRTPGGYTRSGTTTGPGNKSVNRTSTGTWNPATKTWNNSTTYTGPQGKTGTVDKSTTISK